MKQWFGDRGPILNECMGVILEKFCGLKIFSILGNSNQV
jgi:hypothetical protein